MNYRRFINDSYVDHVQGSEYDIVSNVDEEIFVRVDMRNGGVIILNESLLIDNDAKKQLLFSKVDDLMEDNEVETENDYEAPGVAGGIYSNIY